MKIDLRIAEAVGMLRGSNIKAWDIFIEYLNTRLDFERDKCVTVDDDNKNRIHRGKARAFKELAEIDKEVDKVFKSHRGNE